VLNGLGSQRQIQFRDDGPGHPRPGEQRYVRVEPAGLCVRVTRTGRHEQDHGRPVARRAGQRDAGGDPDREQHRHDDPGPSAPAGPDVLPQFHVGLPIVTTARTGPHGRPSGVVQPSPPTG
jgi:hypothetical protein